ncbi:expressed protein [Aureococcus anophagefferens]|uniref:Expressed protein n=1 Tax=Aureococcus anophagefferens TaxID=44056 RepID=F0YS07_AURAN|nr:expressed protein [Aureococcus anophagefferens]EGB02102.1 expressed protein [Aureococcus anophagefferens]|eukprot:XP_009043199.1 expressed protein [Aureococcus anophagefferens]
MPEMGFLATALGAHGQLRVVVLTRDAAAIAASVCDHRNFGQDFGGPGAAGCAKELEFLSKAARLIAAQVAALPATVLCDHYDQEDLTDATRGGLARLGAYLEIDAPTFAAATNAGHKPKKKKEPPHPERDALVAALKEAQEGEQSYPNYGGPRKPEQMPEMGFLATALGAHGQLRVVVLTRDAAAIAASVCDHRHFGGPGPSACAKELELLSKAARLIAAQVLALPATVLCDHYDQEDLIDATRGGHERLGAYLEIDAPTFAAATNAGHAPSKPEPPHPERDALVAALNEAQEGAAAACRARGASSEAKLDA